MCWCASKYKPSAVGHLECESEWWNNLYHTYHAKRIFDEKNLASVNESFLSSRRSDQTCTIETETKSRMHSVALRRPYSERNQTPAAFWKIREVLESNGLGISVDWIFAFGQRLSSGHDFLPLSQTQLEIRQNKVWFGSWTLFKTEAKPLWNLSFLKQRQIEQEFDPKTSFVQIWLAADLVFHCQVVFQYSDWYFGGFHSEIRISKTSSFC